MPNNNNELNIEIIAELDIKKSIAKINADLEKIEQQIKELEVTASLNKGDSLKKINNQIEELNKQKQYLTAELKLNQDALKKQYNEIQNKNEMSLDIKTDKASKQLLGISGNISSVNAETIGLAHSFKSAFANMGLALSTESILRVIKQLAEEATEAVKEYDRMSTNLKIITGKSDVSDLMGDYAERALDMKVDVSEYEKASEVILRAGKNLEESNKYTEAAIKLSKTGFIDAELSANNLLVIANAYDLTADRLENVTDALLTLDTSTNTEAGVLSEAMATSAQNAKLAGLSYEKLGAIIAKLKDSTGKSESELSTSLNQIFNRTYRVKPNAYTFKNEAGETEDLTKPLSDVEKVMNQLGISIRKSKTEFKDFEDIVSTIAPKFKDLSSVDQNAIASVFAGQHKNTFLSLVNDWDEIQTLTRDAENSTGATASKYNSYLQSIESKSATLLTTTKEFWNNLVPDNAVANLTDASTSLIQFVDEYEVLQNIAKTGLIYGLAKGFISAKSGFAGMVKDIKNVSTAFSQLEAVQKASFGTNEYANNINLLGKTVSELTDKQTKLLLSTEGLNDAQKIEIFKVTGLEEAEAKAKLETLGLAKAQKTAVNSTFSLKGGMSALWSVIKANPVGVLTTAFGLLSVGISIHKQKQEELKQKHEEEIQKSKELIETFKEEHTTLETIINKYSELSKKTGLTADEKETLLDYQKQLVETYGKEASGIDLVNGKLENNLAILKSLNDENLKALEANQKKVYLDAKAKYDDFANEAVQHSSLLDEDTGKYIGVHRIEFDDKSFNGNVKNAIQGLINGDVPGIGGGIFAEHLKIDDDAIEILGNTNEDFEMAYAEMVKVLDEISKRSPMVGGVDFTTNSGYKTLLDGLNQLTALRDEAEKRANDLAQTKYAQFTLEKGNAPVNEADFKKWFEDLTEYVNPSGDSALKNALTDIVNNNSERYVVSDTDTGIDKIEQKSLSDIVSSTKTELEDYKKQIDKFVECQSTAKAALTELSESGTLSYETIKKLSEAGLESVISYNAATNSFTVNKEKLDELIGSQKDAIVANMEQSKSNIQLTAQQSKELQEIENWRKKTGRSTSDAIYQHKLEELGVKDITSSYDLYISMLEKADFATNDFSDTVSKINQDIEKYSENISKLSNAKSIVKSAQEEQEKFGRLSIDTIKSLHEAGLSGAMSYNEMTGETYLLVDAIDELTRAQIENQKVDINKSITETTNKIAEASEKLRNIGNPSDAYTANIVSGLNQNIAQWQSQLDELGIQKMELGSLLFSFETDNESTKQSAEEAAKDAAEEYANAVKEAFSKEESELDHLKAMDVITEDTYYDSLAKIVKKYYSDKEMFLDEYRQYEEKIYDHLKQKQIDAIQEQIDALKSVNEEKQEEIDLEKAKQALENAKRNKTISVYDSERGWIHETDRKAIDTAQKEYDDLVLNEKIKALESMIDAIENGTNTNHSLDESVDVIQQVDGMVNGSQEDFINNIKRTLINHGENPIDYINQLNSLPINNVASDQILRNIQAMQENICTTNNKTMTVNIDKVVADDPERFVSQMEQIANKSFDTKFMPAMNNLAEDIKRHRANHRYY